MILAESPDYEMALANSLNLKYGKEGAILLGLFTHFDAGLKKDRDQKKNATKA